MAKESSECPPEMMDSEDHLFLLYTSGSTGKPKGLAHSTAGYLTYASLTQKVGANYQSENICRCKNMLRQYATSMCSTALQVVFDYRPGDIFGCVADIGWITGHSYVVYGPLVNGATTVLFESTPTHPDPGRYWETVQRLKINQVR